MLSGWIPDFTNRTTGANIFPLGFTALQSPFPLDQILILEHFIKFGMAKGNMFDNFITAYIHVSTKITFLKSNKNKWATKIVIVFYF